MDEAQRHLVEGARAVMRLNSAYFQSKVLQSAITLGLFEHLSSAGRRTPDEICAALDLHPRLVPDFLDALTGLGLLERSDGAYSVRAEVADFILKDGALYVGGTAAQHSRMHYHSWGQLNDALQDGKAKSKKIDGTEGFLKFYENTEIVHALMEHMDTFTRFVAPGLASALDWSVFTDFVDIGGARGNLPALLVKQFGHLSGAVFDLPPVKPLFDKHMSRMGTEDRVVFHAGDFLNDPIPAADVAIIGHTLHDWPQERRFEIVARSFDAVKPGGALVIYDAMLDDDRSDPHELLQSLNCGLLGTGASEYTVSECRGYMERAGFRFEQAVPIDSITYDKVAIARKD